MIEKITAALDSCEDQTHSDAAFYAEYRLKPEDVHIEVENVGKVQLPLNTTVIQQLLDISTNAKFGMGERTLLDTKVRNTKEISADKLHVKCNEGTFNTMLQEIHDKLGLSENSKLTPHLHNMLIYGPGQFFKAHQDTEKLSGMIASLVVVLPSPHIGGSLIIHHNDKKHKFISENLDSQEIKTVAFYADCHHEVEKVKQGHRVVLTYNLVLEPIDSSIQEDKNTNISTNTLLEDALKDYFSLDEPSKQALPKILDQAPDLVQNNASKNSDSLNDDLKNVIITVDIKDDDIEGKIKKEHIDDDVANRHPIKLAYFLDHSYTEHSLKWNMLKGNDYKNAIAFLNSAKKLGLVARLALVEVHQSWTAEGDEDDPMPNELIDDDITLSYWLDENNQKLSYKNYDISKNEICWTKDTKEFDPFESEYEGYMGNYGETIDYWYRRAAIVLWREADNVMMNFDLNYNTAINNLLEFTKNPGNEQQVIDIIKKAGKYLHKTRFAYHARSEGSFEYSNEKQFDSLTQLAIYIKNQEVAQSILENFLPTIITAANVQIIVTLQKLYGVSWCLELMTRWNEVQGRQYSFGCITELDLNIFVKNLVDLEADMQLVEFLWQYYLDFLIRCDKYYHKYKPIAVLESVSKRIKLAKGLMQSAAVLLRDVCLRKIVDYLISNPILYPELDLAEMMVSMVSLEKSASKEHALIYEELKLYVMNVLKKELDNGLREESDWSINIKLPCSCEKCKIAEEFLKSRIEIKKIWPIAQEYRTHVKDILKGFGLPLNISELAQGSPHKLVIVKTNKLYLDAKTRFEKIRICLKKLQAI